jgi:hypothetical protein
MSMEKIVSTEITRNHVVQTILACNCLIIAIAYLVIIAARNRSRMLGVATTSSQLSRLSPRLSMTCHEASSIPRT